MMAIRKPWPVVGETGHINDDFSNQRTSVGHSDTALAASL